MKKTFFTLALIILVSFAGLTQSNYFFKPLIGFNNSTIAVTEPQYNAFWNTYTDGTSSYKSTGLNLGFELHKIDMKKFYYLESQINNFKSRYFVYDFKTGVNFNWRIFDETKFYLTPALSFINNQNNFRFGVYTGFGFSFASKSNKDGLNTRVEWGLNWAIDPIGSFKLIISFK